MRFEPKITQKLTLGSMAFSDGWQNYWQSEPSYRPHSENMICANSEREKRDISCRAWENETCTLKITEHNSSSWKSVQFNWSNVVLLTS